MSLSLLIACNGPMERGKAGNHGFYGQCVVDGTTETTVHFGAFEQNGSELSSMGSISGVPLAEYMSQWEMDPYEPDFVGGYV
ncbi:MAG: hypothetical protein KC912_23550 [Proteobacteria bacterium]|nr:hypothetical protein [Pseudomonadota bacterium]